MASGFAFSVLLLVLSCLAMNLTMNFGIGLNWTATAGRKELINYFKRLAVFFPVITILWLIITLIRSLFFTGSAEYIFLFPVCYAVYYSLDNVISRFILKNCLLKKYRQKRFWILCTNPLQ